MIKLHLNTVLTDFEVHAGSSAAFRFQNQAVFLATKLQKYQILVSTQVRQNISLEEVLKIPRNVS